MITLFKQKLKKNQKLLILTLTFFMILGILFIPVNNYLQKIKIEKVTTVMNKIDEKTLDDCKIITDFNIDSIGEENKYFDYNFFIDIKNMCIEKYNFSNFENTKENCNIILNNNLEFFENNFLINESIEDRKIFCSKKYLEPEFGTGSFFNINNDFKSDINLDFKLDFFTDIGEENSEEFIKNRTEAKQRLLKLIEIKPKVDINIEDVYLTNNRSVLSLNLSPLTDYKINFQKTEKENIAFNFKTPDNTYFGMKVLNPLTLYTRQNLPKFEIIDYNTEKIKTKIEVCNILEEDYAKIELFSESKFQKKEDRFQFYKNLKGINCKEKEFRFKETNQVNKNQTVKYKFELKDFIEEKKGLYFVKFIDENDLKFNQRLNKPIFFGIVDSHIMMKINKSNDAFFFVNDLYGNPLINQEITVYLNEFKEYNREYNFETRVFDLDLNSLEDKNIFSKPIVLGKTDKNGILQINLDEKFENAFGKTFESWSFNNSGFYESFFVKSKGINNISYLTSTWNAGIAPWNFGYKVGYSYNSNQKPRLDEWGNVQQNFVHIYTDRKLYLPGEEVFIKGVVRIGDNLEIKEDKEFNLIVKDSKGEEVLNEFVKLSEFGSFSKKINLTSESSLGNYTIFLVDGNETNVYSNFSVEVFKNPKFENEVALETIGLEGETVKINETKITKHTYYNSKKYLGNFKIKANVSSKYYNGTVVKNAKFNYKVYKQDYYGNDYWNNCYYGCYWEPTKTFYTEGNGTIDENGYGNFEVNVDFESNYSDYKYIVEVTVTDSIGDKITGSNSIIAKLPENYKNYNRDSSLIFEVPTKFLKTGKNLKLTGLLNNTEWSDFYNDRYVLVIKRKDYLTKKVVDSNGYDRNINKVVETLEKVLLVNDTNFKLNGDGQLELDYKLEETSEYIFEYGTVNSYYLKKHLGLKNQSDLKQQDIVNVIKKFNETKKTIIEPVIKLEEGFEKCSSKYSSEYPKICPEKKYSLKIDDFVSGNNFISVVTYGIDNGFNLKKDDNKLQVLTEKISYKLGEKAKILIKLPVEKSKILWTIEKNGVIESEIINVNSNIFFKEFEIDDTFIPNAYIGVMMIDTDGIGIPEYKVGYTEVVVDKTDKKSFIDIKIDKKTYKPREEVKLNLKVKDNNNSPVKSELTVMVVDDSLISLMGNVDLNTLEKIYVKLPFSIQTSITNIAMLKNYYFSRMGIVGGSGFGNFKGGDSAVSTRNLFKNTAYFNPNVVTDIYGNAEVSFTLPDNLTNFRVMVIGNSKSNFFGYSENFIEVRKKVILEDKTPLILRTGDESKIGAKIFNNSGKDQDFKITLRTNGIEVLEPVKKVKLKSSESVNIFWDINVNNRIEDITYEMVVLGDSIENSDKLENTIKIKSSPILITNSIKNGEIETGQTLKLSQEIIKNTDIRNSKVEILVSNNKLSGIDKIASSLAKYPYGCIEQTTSSTLPNVVLKRFDKMFSGIYNKEEIEKNISYGISRIESMQLKDGGFAYWPGEKKSDLHITPYVLRSLIYMNETEKVGLEPIKNAVTYLENNFKNAKINDKAEILWALAYSKQLNLPKLGLSNLSEIFENQELNRHGLLALTYAYILNDSFKYSQQIEENINILTSIENKNNNYYYRNLNSDKAIFTAMLIDYDFDKYRVKIGKNISELYGIDWSSYYYSTQTKNNSFISFYKYLEKVGAEKIGDYSLKIGKSKYFTGKLGENNNLVKYEFILSEVLVGKSLDLSLQNNGDSNLYVDFIIKNYPLDKTKIKPSSNGVSISRKYYKVNNEAELSKCNKNYYGGVDLDCKNILTLNSSNIFELNQLYKTVITVNIEGTTNKRNFTIEDYLPGSFRVINNNFKTESTDLKNKHQTWRWSHIENNPDVIMANASYIGSANQVTYSYYFRPEFSGIYTLPPTTGYLMYNPSVKANSEFKIIEVK